MAKTQNQTFVSARGKTLVLFPNIPMEQFRFVVDLAQGANMRALKAKLATQHIDRVLAFRYDMQRMQVLQHRIECFELIKLTAQRGAAGLYKASLAKLVRAANEELASKRHVDVDAIFAEAEIEAKGLAAEVGGQVAA